MSTAIGAGSLIQIGLAVNAAAGSLPVPGSDTFRTIGYITTNTKPSFKKKTISQQTMNDGTLSAGAGLDVQTLTFSYVRNYGNTPHEDVFSDGRNNASQYRNWRLVASDSGTEQWDFVGFIAEWNPQEQTPEAFDIIQAIVNVYGQITVTP